MSTNPLHSDLRVHRGNLFTPYLTPQTCPPKKHGFEEAYDFVDNIGKGGFGTVTKVRSRSTQDLLACKTVPIDDIVQQKQEVISLTMMQGGNATVPLFGIYEDDNQKKLHIITKLGCESLYDIYMDPMERDGTVLSEESFAYIMRQVLKCIHLAHQQGIMHLDIKLGNFVWLDESRTQLVAIDWGLSATIDKDQHFRDDLGCRGTPWYMAPEQMRSETTPKTDIWAAGVLLYQLICTKFPFTDRKNPSNPSVACIWRSVLEDDPSFSERAWSSICDDAKDFIKCLLRKDPKERPTVQDALMHPWMKKYEDIHQDEKTREKSRELRKQFQGVYYNIALEWIIEVAKHWEGLEHISPTLLSSTPGKELRRNPRIKNLVSCLYQELSKRSGKSNVSVSDIALFLSEWTYQHPWFQEAEMQKVSYQIKGRHLASHETISGEEFEQWLLGSPSWSTQMF